MLIYISACTTVEPDLHTSRESVYTDKCIKHGQRLSGKVLCEFLIVVGPVLNMGTGFWGLETEQNL